jgi:hypothetical protein
MDTRQRGRLTALGHRNDAGRSLVQPACPGGGAGVACDISDSPTPAVGERLRRPVFDQKIRRRKPIRICS